MNPMAMTKEGAAEDTAIKPFLANVKRKFRGNRSQYAYFPGAGFQEIFSLFPSTKAFNVERILLTFTR